jgi:hypothetical protein
LELILGAASEKIGADRNGEALPRRRASGPLNRPDREEVGAANKRACRKVEDKPGCLTSESDAMRSMRATSSA